jgi:phosphatidate cytidylyltransferase
MTKRILTALILAPLAICAVLFLPTGAFMVLVAALLLLGLWEWTRLVGLVGHARRAIILLLNAALLAWLAWQGWIGREGLFPWIAVVGVIWWCLAALWLMRMKLGSTPTPRNLALKLAIGSLLVLPAWCAMALLHGDATQGPAWTLYALLLVWAADSGAWFVGSRVGGRKLAPSISPGKTWAGLWGGLATVVLVALAAVPVFGLGWNSAPTLVAASVLTGLASVVGDLFESIIKRHSGAKDSGYLVPGHGGVLDRIDSVVAALPVFLVSKEGLGL